MSVPRYNPYDAHVQLFGHPPIRPDEVAAADARARLRKAKQMIDPTTHVSHGGLFVTVLPGEVEAEVGSVCGGQWQRISKADLRRFCEDTLRVLNREAKEERALERLARRLYGAVRGEGGGLVVGMGWDAALPETKESYRKMAIRFRAIK